MASRLVRLALVVAAVFSVGGTTAAARGDYVEVAATGARGGTAHGVTRSAYRLASSATASFSPFAGADLAAGSSAIVDAPVAARPPAARRFILHCALLV